jgi:hypothetical protein
VVIAFRCHPIFRGYRIVARSLAIGILCYIGTFVGGGSACKSVDLIFSSGVPNGRSQDEYKVSCWQKLKSFFLFIFQAFGKMILTLDAFVLGLLAANFALIMYVIYFNISKKRERADQATTKAGPGTAPEVPTGTAFGTAHGTATGTALGTATGTALGTAPKEPLGTEGTARGTVLEGPSAALERSETALEKPWTAPDGPWTMSLLEFLSGPNDEDRQHLKHQFRMAPNVEAVGEYIRVLARVGIIELRSTHLALPIIFGQNGAEVRGLTTTSAQLTVVIRHPKKSEVAVDYFHRRHRLELQFPELPCVEVIGGYVKNCAPKRHTDVYPMELISVCPGVEADASEVWNDHAFLWAPRPSKLSHANKKIDEPESCDFCAWEPPNNFQKKQNSWEDEFGSETFSEYLKRTETNGTQGWATKHANPRNKTAAHQVTRSPKVGRRDVFERPPTGGSNVTAVAPKRRAIQLGQNVSRSRLGLKREMILLIIIGLAGFINADSSSNENDKTKEENAFILPNFLVKNVSLFVLDFLNLLKMEKPKFSAPVKPEMPRFVSPGKPGRKLTDEDKLELMLNRYVTAVTPEEQRRWQRAAHASPASVRVIKEAALIRDIAKRSRNGEDVESSKSMLEALQKRISYAGDDPLSDSTESERSDAGRDDSNESATDEETVEVAENVSSQKPIEGGEKAVPAGQEKPAVGEGPAKNVRKKMSTWDREKRRRLLAESEIAALRSRIAILERTPPTVATFPAPAAVEPPAVGVSKDVAKSVSIENEAVKNVGAKERSDGPPAVAGTSKRKGEKIDVLPPPAKKGKQNDGRAAVGGQQLPKGSSATTVASSPRCSGCRELKELIEGTLEDVMHFFRRRLALFRGESRR